MSTPQTHILQPSNVNRLTRWLGAGLAVFLIGLHLVSLLRHPVPSCDEALYSSASYSVLTTGQFGIPTVNNVAGIGQNYVPLGRLVLIGQAIFQALWPDAPLLAARLFSLTGVLVLITSACALVKLLSGDRSLSAWTALLLAAHWAIFTQGHSGRPDLWLAAGIMAATYLVFRLHRSTSRWLALLVGAAVALLDDIHLNGVHFILALGLVTVFVLGPRRRRWDLVALFVVGGILGALYFVAAHLLPNPQQAVAQYNGFVSGAGYSAWNAAALGSGIIDWARWLYANFASSYGGLMLPVGLFYVAGIVITLVRRDFDSLLLLAIIVLSLLTFSIVNVFKPDYYGLLWHPLLLVLSTMSIRWIASRLPEPTWRPSQLPAIPNLLLGGVLALFVAGDLYLTVKFRTVDYAAYVEPLSEVIHGDGLVYADSYLWYALKDRQMADSIYLGWVHFANQEPLWDETLIAAEFDKFSPEYIILDEQYACVFDGSPAPPQVYVSQYATAHCREVARLTGSWFETSRVYRCPSPSE